MLSQFLAYIWIGLPVGAWLTNLLTGKRVHSAVIYVLIVIAGYFVLVSSVFVLDAELEAKMNSFDLDGDGGIGGAELTPEAEQAMEDWASDTGRSFAPIIGAPLTAIWYTILFGLVVGCEWIFRSLFMRKNSAAQADESVAQLRDDDDDPPRIDNPYHPPNRQ